MKKHFSPEESKQSFLEQFEEGTQRDGWVAFICTKEGKDEYGNNRYTTRKTSSNFPVEEYTTMLLSLKNVLDEEIEMQLGGSVVRPLALASHLRATDSGIQEKQKKDFEEGRYPSILPSDNKSNNEEEKTNEENVKLD